MKRLLIFSEFLSALGGFTHAALPAKNPDFDGNEWWRNNVAVPKPKA